MENVRRKSISYLVFSAITLIGIIILCVSLYRNARNNILSIGEMEAYQSARNIESYLQENLDILEMVAKRLEIKMEQGATRDEMSIYLKEESEISSVMLPEDFSDFYMYYKGFYLDEENWDPGEDFVATERPWYRYAVQANGEPCLVSPYVDAMTGNVVLSACQLLSDGRSAVVMDIYLTELQDLTATLADAADGTVLVISDDGYIAGSSDASVLGQSITDAENKYYPISESTLSNAESELSVRLTDGHYTAFNVEISDGWHTVILLNSRRVFDSIYYIYLEIIGIILVAVISGILILRYDKVRNRMMNRDPMTGLMNRLAYEEMLRKQRMKKELKLSVFVMDINGLKRVNDTLGHASGDILITEAADAIRHYFGELGDIYRTGGDEFLVVMNEMNVFKLLELKVGFYHYLEEIQVRLEIPLSISVGFTSTSKQEFRDAEEVIRSADKWMYDDKAKYYIEHQMIRE